MKINQVTLFVVCGILNCVPFSLSAVSAEDLAEALNCRKACPVVEEELASQ